MISHTRDQAKIYFVPGLEEYSSMNIPDHFAISTENVLSETVQVESIDDLVERHGLRPALIKVDVEGAEFSVFAGARKSLSKYRPVVISELWRGPTRADGHLGTEIVQMFEGLNYIALNPNTPQAKLGQGEFEDAIFIPREKYNQRLFST
jgi:hypothetical protein